MPYKRSLHVLIVLSWCLASLCPSTVAWCRLKDPGLSESEIKQRWNAFEEVKDELQPRGDYPFIRCFEEAARKYGLPLALLLAMARGESDFDPKARSHKNALGIMQIKWPETARDLGIHRKSDLFDPCINIDAGARYLARLLERFKGDTYLAVAAYNYGPNAVRSDRVPAGAQWYAAYIHRHLQFTMSQTYTKTGRVLVLGFTYYRRAAKFLAYLETAVTEIPFEIYRSRRYTYDIYFTYKTRAEHDRYLGRLQDATNIQPEGVGLVIRGQLNENSPPASLKAQRSQREECYFPFAVEKTAKEKLPALENNSTIHEFNRCPAIKEPRRVADFYFPPSQWKVKKTKRTLCVLGVAAVNCRRLAVALRGAPLSLLSGGSG